MSQFLIALGANLQTGQGDLASILAKALQVLDTTDGVRVARVSRFFRTPAYPPGAGPDFVNAAAVLVSDHEPGALLSVLHGVEADMGRSRPSRWAPRVLDLDLLGAGNRVLPDRETARRWMALDPGAAAQEAPETMILPHPRLHERGFVLIPLCDVAPDWVHPLTGRSVQQMADALSEKDRDGIIPL